MEAGAKPAVANPTVPEVIGKAWEASVIRALAAGKQTDAEDIVQSRLEGFRNKQKGQIAKEAFVQTFFWQGVLERSRFQVERASVCFGIVLGLDPNSLEGRTAAAIIGIDCAANKPTAFHFYNALLTLAEQNPKSVPVLWLTGIMSRSLTGNGPYSNSISYPERVRICNSGVQHYEKLLKEMLPGNGPALVHQTLANLLDELDCHDLAIYYREMAVSMERAPWSLGGLGTELVATGYYEEAIPVLQETVQLSGNQPSLFQHEKLGRAFANLARYPEALDAWDLAFTAKPTGNQNGYWDEYIKLCRITGDYPRGWAFAKKVLEQNPNAKVMQVWEARMAAVCGDPDATRRQKAAGTFKFNGKVIKDDEDGNSTPNPWSLALDYGDEKAFFNMVLNQ